jgi:hypothetical protein
MGHADVMAAQYWSLSPGRDRLSAGFSLPFFRWEQTAVSSHRSASLLMWAS